MFLHLWEDTAVFDNAVAIAPSEVICFMPCEREKSSS